MARMMHWSVAIPKDRRPSPRFGMGSFYRQTTQTRNPLGNLFYKIPLSFYREAYSPLPYPVGTDLLGSGPLPSPSGSNLTGQPCPVKASGQPCPLAPRAAPGNGRAYAAACPSSCPFTGSARKFRAPRFGMGFLGQQYIDPQTLWTVNSVGTINDNTGSAVYDQDMTPAEGTYGPFTVDEHGNITQGGATIYTAASGLIMTPLVTSAAPALSQPATATAAKVAATVAPIASSTAAFLAAPTGYTAASTAAAPVSWWNGSTRLFGTTIKNSSLAVGAVIFGGAALMLGKKKGR